ncbi:MAG TPA: DoxX family protein [Allosphingosinicella sp.]|nr:DoxX family protein [Allosphingosinicella sp.]
MAPIFLSILRIVTGLLFLEHGLQKLAGFPAAADPTHLPPLNTLPGFAGYFELGCGLLIAIGFLTRPAAFLASGTMAVAYWYAHAPQNFFPVNNMGDAAILYCFVFLYLVFAGPGPWSVDAMRSREAPPQA